jgi:hypothetical protein
MYTAHHLRRRATWRQHFLAVARRAVEAGIGPAKAGMRPGLKTPPVPNGPRGCAPSHS